MSGNKNWVVYKNYQDIYAVIINNLFFRGSVSGYISENLFGFHELRMHEMISFTLFKLLRTLFLILTAGYLLTGCDTTVSEEKIIDLDKLQPLPTLQTEQSADTLKVAVAAIISPQGTIQSYQPFLSVLEKKTGKNVVLVQRKTYQEVNNLLIRNAVDVAFICTGAYVRQKESMKLLAIPQINGKKTYQSLLIVPRSSQILTFSDLRGKVFAFTDPLSNTGHRYPLTLLNELGETPESYFSRTIFTYSHDRSIDSIIDGIANGAAVDSIIYDFFKKRDPVVESKTRVIKESPEYGMPPVVVPLSISPAQKKWLKDIFLQIHNDPEGRKALDILGVDKFVEADPDYYHF